MKYTTQQLTAKYEAINANPTNELLTELYYDTELHNLLLEQTPFKLSRFEIKHLVNATYGAKIK